MKMPLSLIAVPIGEARRPPPDKRGAVVGRRQLVACTDAVHGLCVIWFLLRAGHRGSSESSGSPSGRSS